MRWPKYATYIFMKYYISKTDPNETFVSVNYAGEVNRIIIGFLFIFNSFVFLATNIVKL